MVENGASDLHITAGVAPALRVNGEIVRVKIPPLTPTDTKRIVYQILSEDQKNEFEKNLELDLSFGIKGLARFRSNVFYSKGAIAAAFRLVPTIIPDFKSLKLPSILLSMTDIDSGLILVTGPTGSGKSTTLASLLDRLNDKELAHIITVEDPIEFVHTHKKCIVNQREVGSDTNDFSDAMRSLLRQDPDIILIGELRDKETVEAAIKIAETGHLVFGTLHTNSCVQTINRLVNVFPADQQDQIRTLLSFVLQGIVSQRLIKKSFEPGRVVSIELMIPNIGIRNLIRENKIHQLYSQMQTGQERSGMITMNQSLFKLVEAGIITPEIALLNTTVPEELKQMLGIKEKDGYE
ncbi:MAG: type IV pili twitching motility protein PilT [Bdellovibrionales bacterium RIFOXYB1_FULL_37_110]|nr:MAG: type IV pili twitching motility protein PilT [Bdellovibrionales bacterium RIFOXYA1_FULL_38_20]OFZ51200.1 MAG: type IV pili twitching motility protein PilT [Bdellovibrionales bacterium RIFOXYC1_FULL_37_79]OFZ59617.1 MAG: type IV pili twitching motility protein PilT [Bdellovibrionales bacterium RIFOXYB2_FULL_36_6]OFZ61306.1 MAG: type IV pili twitching motility protein PilT [Bdellovibrionales bacterium RIFOXYB1_FULL_37_110]OFZ62169.1 MAG: type IV pili twitching motility protein PilT [Bdell